MDWRGVTREWVREGLISEAQREPLLRWLDTHAPPNRWLGERVLPALVALATWMLTGSAYVVSSAHLADHGGLVAVAFAVVGAVQGVLGGAALAAGQDGIATGAVSAGLVVFGLAVAGWTPDPLGALAVGGAITAVGTAAAMRLRSRGVSLAALAAGLWSAASWLDAGVTVPTAGWLAVVALGSMGAYASALRQLPWALPSDPIVLFPTLVLLRLSWETTATGGAHGLVAAASAGALGAACLGMAALARSAGFLAAGVAAFGFAEAYLVDGVPDRAVAVYALGGQGLLLLLGVFAFVGWRSGRSRRPVDAPPG